MLPNVDSGIFLDNDMLVLQDPAILWDRFKLFTPFTAIAVAPVEAHYSRQMVSSEQSCSFSPTSHLKLILSNNKCAVKSNFLITHWAWIIWSLERSCSLLWGSRTWPQCWTCSHELDQVLFHNSIVIYNYCLTFIFRLRDLPGGGFTEIARFIWEKYRLPDITIRCRLQQCHHLKTRSLQVKVEACRPGRVEHCRSAGTLASSAASLQMELPHMDGSFTPHCCVL